MIAFFTRPKLAAAAILLVLVILSLIFLVPLLAVIGGRSEHLPMLVDMLPLPLYIWAIWAARRAILLIGSGAALKSVLSRMLTRIGIALFAGGLVRVFGVPLAYHLLNGSRTIGFYDPAAITVGVVGLTLVIVARLVAEAEAMRAELDEFF